MAMHPHRIIDRASREAATSLIFRFRDGKLTNDQFEDQWPCSDDRALRAISTMIWCFYNDTHEHTLTGRYGLTAEGHALMTRCALFAESDLPYEWPEDNFIGIGGLGSPVILGLTVLSAFWLQVWWPLMPLTIGSVLLIDQWVKRRLARFWERMETIGDLSIWPFIHQADYEKIKANLGAC
jgi:hypothetical protein